MHILDKCSTFLSPVLNFFRQSPSDSVLRCNITKLSEDVLTQIFIQLELKDIPSISRTCKKFNQITLKDSFWKLLLQKMSIDHPLISLKCIPENKMISQKDKDTPLFWKTCVKVEIHSQNLLKGKIQATTYSRSCESAMTTTFDKDHQLFALGLHRDHKKSCDCLGINNEFISEIGCVINVKTQEKIYNLEHFVESFYLYEVTALQIDILNNYIMGLGKPENQIYFWELTTGKLLKELSFNLPSREIRLDEKQKLCVLDHQIIDYNGNQIISFLQNEHILKYDNKNSILVTNFKNMINVYKTDFSGCDNLEKISLFENVNSINPEMFYYDDTTMELIGINLDRSKIEIRGITSAFSQTIERITSPKEANEKINSIHYDANSGLIFLAVIRKRENSPLHYSFIEIYEKNNPKMINQFETYNPHLPSNCKYYPIFQMNYDHSEKLLISLSTSGSLVFWSAETGKFLFEHKNEMPCVKFFWDKKGIIYLECPGQKAWGFTILNF